MEDTEFMAKSVLGALREIGTRCIDSDEFRPCMAVVQVGVNPELPEDFIVEVDMFTDVAAAFLYIKTHLSPVEKPSFNCFVVPEGFQDEATEQPFEIPSALWPGESKTASPRANKYRVAHIPASLYGMRHMRGHRG